MKCPKCEYLGFEPVDRCRNCGYEFSLTSSPTPSDLRLRLLDTDNEQLPGDLALTPPDRGAPSSDTLRAAARLGATPMAAHGVITPSELPLFGSSMPDDAPLITKLSPPRQPLAVRRATPEVPRLRLESRPLLRDQTLPELGEPVSAVVPVTVLRRPREEPVAARDAAPSGAPSSAPSTQAAAVSARVSAATIDILVLLALDATVVYFTLQICGLTRDDLALLPKVPMLGFLALQDLSYFVAFTVGGQTLGQMAMGVRVLLEDSERAPDVSRALLRTLLWLMMLTPAGVGLLTVLLDGGRRGVHDRIARTRVVRATV